MSADAFHIAAPEPEGMGAARAVAEALQRSGLDPSDVDHVNAHATSTPVGDVAEARAIRRALGSAADHIAVSGTKSMTGHLLGAAGAVEAVFAVCAVRDRVAPPTINITDLDPDVDLDVVRDEPRTLGDGQRPVVALSNSFGFGGHNVAVVVRSAS